MAKKKKTIFERLTVPHSFQIPMVKNVAELAKMKAAPRKPMLIHFTADQWKQASKGIRQGKGIPKKGFRFVGIPDPDGGFLFQPECVPSPNEECILQPIPRPGSPRALEFVCLCRPKDPLIPPPEPLCTLVLSINPLELYCEKRACTGNCRIYVVTSGGPLPRTVVTCGCA